MGRGIGGEVVRCATYLSVLRIPRTRGEKKMRPELDDLLATTYHTPMRFVPEIRYDLDSDIARLDMESQIGLMDLAVAWSERNAALAAEVLDLEPFEDVSQWRCLVNPTISIRK